jgi:uncharacterized lipoprotein YbaY
MRRTLLCVLLVALALAACACRAGSPKGAAVSGKVFATGNGSGYRVGDTLILQLWQSGPAGDKVVAQRRETITPGWEAAGTHPPVGFELPYDARAIDANLTYWVSGQVVEDGKTIGSGTSSPVITHGSPSSGIELRIVGS